MGAQRSIKGQFEISESLLVTFVIVLIIAIGMFLYYRYSVQSIDQRGQTFQEEQASLLLARITAFPEIGCDHEDCLDTSKLLPFNSLMRGEPTGYRQLFGNRRIMVYQVYPATQHFLCDTLTYQSLGYPDNCDSWEIYRHTPDHITSTMKVSKIVSLYFPELQAYRIGKVEIETYT